MDYATAEKAFGDISGTTFVGMDTVTVVKLKGGRKNPYQGRLTKRMTGANVLAFGNVNTSAYVNMVRKRLGEEGKDPESYQPKPRTWGQHIPGTAFVEHLGEHFVEVIFIRSGKIEYLLDGQVIDLTVPPLGVENWLELPEKSFNPNGQGGLSEDKRVIPRCFKLVSVIEARTNGMIYR